VSNNAHIYKNEKGPFLDNLGGMYPELFLTDKFGTPKMDSVKELIDGKKIDLLCLENTHNNLGGTCIPEQQLGDVCSYARENGVPVHIDGARIFNAAAYLNIQVKDLTRHVDSVMFCISKGLGAPVGSMLCGSKEFIAKARKTKKLLGGTMRQAGVLAAAGLIAIQQGKERLKEDHENAYILASRIAGNKKIAVDMETVQTNIVIADVSPSGLDAKTFEQELEKRGLKLKSMSEKHIRMVTYRGICKKDAIEAANIINELCASL
jgi:threonine aldolase